MIADFDSREQRRAYEIRLSLSPAWAVQAKLTRELIIPLARENGRKETPHRVIFPTLYRAKAYRR